MTALLVAALLQQNLIPNGSFSKIESGRPVGWSTEVWGGQARFGMATSPAGGAVTVQSETGADAAWTTVVRVRPYSKYRFSALIRTESVNPVAKGLGALVNIHGRPERTEAITGTSPWTPVAMTIDTGADDALQFNCLLGYFGTAKGAAYFADLSLELIETRELHPSVMIDAAKRFPPISKYIYSQFIEHLGRCIYGGIWAEMLQDRKFFYPVGSKDSHWKVIGSAAMTSEGAFAGDSSPEVHGSISQGGLWLEKGKRYVGHAWLRGEGQVACSLGGSRVMGPLSGHWSRTDFAFTAKRTVKDGELCISGTKPFLVGAVSLMPADNIRGMRRDVLALLKQLNAPLYRWPGGNFASGYDWRDGIGDRDRRPTRKNPAWQGIEPNDFGTHEFLDFCKEVGAEPLIVTNAGFGDSHSAGEWVEYVNGAGSTEEGRRRSENGRPSPWKVKWWGIGNEMYGDWQLGHIPLSQYTIKHGLFYTRMKRTDPSIKIIAVGEVGPWSSGMLTQCATQMDLISEHLYCQERAGVMAHVAQMTNAIRAKVAAHRLYRKTLPSLKGKDIKIAVDEWNYWYGPDIYGELGTRYFMKDALGIAAGLHEFFRSTDIVDMAQYAQTVNVLGAIKTTPTSAALEATGLVLELYRQHFGSVPVAVEGAPEPLDVSVALTQQGSLTLGIVNPTAESMPLDLKFNGMSTPEAMKGWEIANADPLAFNTPGEEARIRIKEIESARFSGRVVVAPYSVTLLHL